MKWHWIAFRCGLMAMASIASAESGGRVKLDKMALDRTEVTIGQFRKFIADSRLETAAERDGGGHEFAGGWTRRPGWTWSTPFGEPAADDEPAVHVSWSEARDYCSAIGGRLPTLEEWARAAYTETRADPTDDFATGRTYPYPVGDSPDGMNTSGKDRWPRHAAVGTTTAGHQRTVRYGRQRLGVACGSPRRRGPDGGRIVVVRFGQNAIFSRAVETGRVLRCLYRVSLRLRFSLARRNRPPMLRAGKTPAIELGVENLG